MSQALRAYQSDAIDAVLAAWERVRRVLLVMPCAAGKTTVAAEIIRREAEAGRRVLFIAHRMELIEQAAARFRHDFGIDCGIIMRAVEDPRPDALVQVASIDTLRSKRSRANPMDPPPALLFFDEAHRSANDSCRIVLDMYPEARVCGLTASPWRADGKPLGAIYQDLIVGSTPAELIAAGYLCDYTGFSFDKPDMRGVHRVMGDFDKEESAAVMMKSQIMGNVVQKYLDHRRGKRALLFAVNVEHSKRLRDAFIAVDVPAEHVDADTPTVERKAVVQRLRDGATHVVCNVGLFTDGTDLPAVEGCIIARPTTSLALHIQMCGRPLRKDRDNPSKVAWYHDHAQNFLRPGLGLPDQDREYSLAVAATPRKHASEPDPEGGITVCKKCFAILRAGVAQCTQCGTAKPVRVVKEATGVAVPLEQVRAAKTPKEPPLSPGLRRVYVAFCKWMIVRRMDPSEMKAKFGEKFGVPLPESVLAQTHAEVAASRAQTKAQGEMWGARSRVGAIQWP